MIAKIGSRGLGAARGFDRAALDFYPTDEKLSRALIAAEKFNGGIWEPACGDGALSKILAETTYVNSTDLASYGFGRGGVDFLKTTELRKDASNIVTNPPFNLWQDFAHHALSLRPRKVALLGRLLLLEGKKRAEFFRASRLARVHIVGRGKMLPRGAKDKGHTGMICFAWFIWDTKHQGPPQIRWEFPK